MKYLIEYTFRGKARHLYWEGSMELDFARALVALIELHTAPENYAALIDLDTLPVAQHAVMAQDLGISDVRVAARDNAATQSD